MKLPLPALLLGVLLVAVPALAAADGEATVVFLRPSGLSSAKVDLHLCAIADGEPVPLGDLERRGKLTRQLPAGAHRFVAYSTGRGMGGRIDSYLEAELKAGRTYYVAALYRLNTINLYTGVPHADFDFDLVPFKAAPADQEFSLMSKRLREWIQATVESDSSRELDPSMAKRIRKALPRLEREQAKYRRLNGDAFTLQPDDSHPADESLATLQLADYTSSATVASETIAGELVALLEPPAALSLEEIRDAILQAGRHRQYQLLAEADDRFVFRLQHRGYDATYTVVYSNDSVQLFSQAFRLKELDTPVEHEGWTANLRRAIDVYFQRAAERKTVYEEVADFDPEGLAARDWGTVLATLSVPEGLTLGEIQEMIVRGAEHRHYAVVARAPGHVVVRLAHRGLTATYSLRYDVSAIALRGEIRKTDRPDKIVSNPRWLENLKSSIAVYLTRRAS